MKAMKDTNIETVRFEKACYVVWKKKRDPDTAPESLGIFTPSELADLTKVSARKIAKQMQSGKGRVIGGYWVEMND